MWPNVQQTRLKMSPLNCSTVPAPPSYFSHAVKVKDPVYVFGDCGVSPADGSFVPGTVADRTTQAMNNVETILSEVGFDLTNSQSRPSGWQRGRRLTGALLLRTDAAAKE